MRSAFPRSTLPYWMVPLIYVVATIVVASLLPRVEYRFLPGLSHDIPAASAIAIFSSIASGMIALTAIVFSIAFVMVQFTSSAYSPRLVFWFEGNPSLLHSLGLFSATFIYALVTLAWVGRGEAGRVPFISTWLVIPLLACSMFAFLRLIRDLSTLQITNVLYSIGHRGRQVIREMYPSPAHSIAEKRFEENLSSQPEKVPITQTLYFSGEPLVVASIDIPALVRLARKVEGLIFLRYAVGDAVMEGAALLHIHGGKRQLPESELLQMIELRRERTFDQDPKYAIRLLVDIAIRALSPAINDPTTAVQAIDQIEDLLRRLAARNLGSGRVRDAEGALRLIFPTPKWDDFLALAFAEISSYGATSLQVMRRLRSALNDLAELVQPAGKGSVLPYIEHLDDLIGHSFTDKLDRMKAQQEDRQGLGLTSRRR